MSTEYVEIEFETQSVVGQVAKYWWLWLVIGLAWLGASYVILQFNTASIKTVGIIAGIMFIVLGTQNIVLAAVADRHGWIWAIFGVIFLLGGLYAFVFPSSTFAAVADMLGLLFFMLGAFWLIAAFATRDFNDLWWLGLIAGILMLAMAFWTSGQYLFDKGIVLLAFSGVWAMMQGFTDIVRAFQFRRLGKVV